MGWYACCGTRRRFLTRQERIERLEAYADQLDKELTAVRQRIEDLEG